MARLALAPTRPAPRSTVLVGGALLAAVAVGALSTIEPFYAAALVLGIGLVLLVATNIQALTLFLVFTMFVESVTLGGSLRIGRLAAVMALLVVALYLLTRGGVGLRVNALALLVGAYGAWMLGSIYWAGDAYYVYDTLLRYSLAIAYMLAFAVLVRTHRQVASILVVLAVGALVFGTIAFVNFAATATDAAGLQGDKNFFASYQVAALAPALAVGAQLRGPGRGVMMVAVAAIGVSIVASLSRGGLLALVLVVLATLLAPSRLLFEGVRQKLVYVGALGVAAVIGVLAGSNTFIERVQSIGNAAPTGDRGSGRLDLWAAALQGFRREPVVGLGAGNFQAESLDLLRTTPGVDVGRRYVYEGRVVHSMYLENLTDLGVIGFAIFMGVLGLTAWYFVRAASRALAAGDVVLARYATAFLLSLFGIAVAGIFLSNQLSKPLWILVGMALALDVMTREYAVMKSSGSGGIPYRPRRGSFGSRTGRAGVPPPGGAGEEEKRTEQERRLKDGYAALEVERKRLRRREAELAHREQILRAHEIEARRLQRLQESEAPETPAAVTGAPPAAVPADLEERAAALQARIDALTTRELQLARRHAQLAKREQALGEGELRPAPVEAPAATPDPAAPLPAPPVAVPQPEPPVPVVATPDAPPTPPLEPIPVVAGAAPTLLVLEQLVDQHGAGLGRADEWHDYLFYLREFADLEGRLPESFDSLVFDVFGDLIDAR